jgi:hypothetical protein
MAGQLGEFEPPWRGGYAIRRVLVFFELVCKLSAAYIFSRHRSVAFCYATSSICAFEKGPAIQRGWLIQRSLESVRKQATQERSKMR